MGRYTGKKCRLLTMLWLTALFFLVEIVVGYVTNSMALIADSFHMLSDVAALVVAFLSVKMSPKKWSKNTFGWARAEVLGALVNAVFLVALCFSITVEACKRFIEVEEIHEAKLLVGVGGLGLLVNVIGLCLFHEHGSAHGHSHGISRSHNRLSTLVGTDDNENDEAYRPSTPQVKRAHGHSHDASQMNMRGVFLHVLSDALGSVIVIVSALIVWLTNWKYRTIYNREKYKNNINLFLDNLPINTYISELARPHVKILQYAAYLAISIISDNIHGGQRFWLVIFSFSSVTGGKAFHVRNSIGVEYFTLLTTVPDLFSIKPSFNCTLSILLNFSLLRGGVAGLFVTLLAFAAVHKQIVAEHYQIWHGINQFHGQGRIAQLSCKEHTFYDIINRLRMKTIVDEVHTNELWTWTKLCSCIGSICFVISDTLLGFHYFHNPLPYSQVSIMLTYYAAQLGIALSAVDSKNNSNNRVPASKG
ncbi:Zinc/cadmium resistance protein [Trachymyrmex cornetzi]|uniref:lysoplasmalogenase n=1 Tax=Trachymyrmex cornetzi TaxID=471704 RepID=A0A195DLR0_9HYME|nr:Zinc/cadmium resistance protein [Trachymyrmex cornetzi]